MRTCRHLWSVARRVESPTMVITRQRCEVCGAGRIGEMSMRDGKSSGVMSFKVTPGRLEPEEKK